MKIANPKYSIGFFFLPALILLLGTYLLYPYCQFYIDPDAIAYLTVAKHYAVGDIPKAVNGYWSPWSCWLTALLIKMNFTPFTSAIVVNTVGALGFLWASQFLFLRYSKQVKLNYLLSVTFSCFIVYAVYKQSFADLWYCCFLMILILLITKEHFIKNIGQWILAGLLCCLAYYAKAYALPFGLLSISVVVFLQMKAQQMFSFNNWATIFFTVTISCFLFASPWLWMLYHKYGIVTTGTAGSLNLSWYLVGHPYFKSGIDLLLPPVYSGGIYYWEDPWVANGALPHFYSSPSLFIKQLAKVVQNILKFISSMNELSAFMLPIYILATGALCSKKMRMQLPPKLIQIIIVFLIFPLAYFLINFESRYLWFMLPFALLLGALVLVQIKIKFHSKVSFCFISACFLLSFLAFPIWDMKNMIHEGYDEYSLAQQMKQANIKGSMASNISYGKEMQHVVRLAYFLDNDYYYMPLPPKRNTQLLHELSRYKVRYFLHYHNGYDEGFEMKDINGRSLPCAFENKAHTIKVYDLSSLWQ